MASIWSDREVEPVIAAELEHEVVARRPGDGPRDHPGETSHAVLAVDHELPMARSSKNPSVTAPGREPPCARRAAP